MAIPTDPFPASGLYSFAWQYAETAKKVANEPELSDVAFFLTCHSIELALKAFLRAKGWEMDELRRLGKSGHDLQAALEAGEKEGLGKLWHIDRGFRNCLLVLNVPYEAKHFEYILICPAIDSVKRIRVMMMLLRGAEELLASIKPVIHAAME
jgi:hypothetical protein